MQKLKTAWLIVRKWLLRGLLAFVGLSLFLVLLFKWVNPYWNMTMVSRKIAAADDKKYLEKTWVSLDKLGTRIQLAAICGEDQRFCDHFGFDIDAIKKAAKNNMKGRVVKGGSTISQQTAKNVFLWGGRSYLRKILEAWFTLLIEIFWGKERIMEVYLNVAETGNMMFGVEAASQHYFHIRTNELSINQAAAIISILPSPRKWQIGRYPANRRQVLIIRAMRYYGIQLTYLK